MKNRNIIIGILIILISGSVFTSCGSTDSELEEALENGDVSSHGNVSSNAEFEVNAGDDQIVTLNETVTLNGDKSSDPNGNALTYFWEFILMPTGSAISLINQNTVNPTFNPDKLGVYEIRLNVNNGTESKTDVLIITVNEASGTNTAPVANAGDDRVMTQGSTITLNGTESSDPDSGDTLEYSWEIIPYNSNAFLNNSTIAEPQFFANMARTYEIRLTVDDGSASNSDTVIVTVVNTDTDEDGVTNNTDNCPGIANQDQEDADNDGIGDVCDTCNNVTDPDCDGVNNSIDNCPTDSNHDQIDFDEDGLGNECDDDDDDDGVPDNLDQCSETQLGAYVDDVGCVYPHPIPDTGQTTCYNAAGDVIPCPTGENAPFYGQDAQYSIHPPSYTKLDSNGNVVMGDSPWVMVRDNVTGLIWEVKTDDGSVHDKDNTYTWYDSNPLTNGVNAGTEGEGTDTEDFINSLNNDSFGGNSDWRLPNIKELKSLVDSGRYNPSVSEDYFKNTMSPNYWSSTTHVDNIGSAWLINFQIGAVFYFPKSNAYYVRAVRGEQSASSYTNNLNGTITDNNTGLIWMQATADTDGDGDLDLDDRLNWENALSYCENLIFAEQSDWRLPTDKEIQSIVDYNHYRPAIDTAYFLNTMLSYYWSSTTYVNDTGNAWLVDFSSGYYSKNTHKSNAYYVRAVRGGH